MNVELYHQRRAERLARAPKFRRQCMHCRQPSFSCYCEHLKLVRPGIHFTILMHPLEHKKRIATGRMSHLSLPASRLIVGAYFNENAELNSVLADTSYRSVMLYPGRLSLNLTSIGAEGRAAWVAKDRRPLNVVVIDGTWGTARQMVNQSANLYAMDRVGFIRDVPSNFRVRKQPRRECVSTIEAIHHTIELLGSAYGFDVDSRGHDQLLDVFDRMVTRQLELTHSIVSI